MKQKILIGLSAGALLLMAILTIAPNIDSRSMNTNQFNVAGNRLSIRDGVRLTNQQSGTIKDDAGVTRIILASGAASGFNDGSGASRIEADVGGSVKLKDATANSALEITSIGDAVFSHTAFLDTLLSPDLANTTGFYLSDVTYPGEILFYNNGIPTVSLSRNQSWFNAGSNYFSGVLHVVGKSIFDGTLNTSGTGGGIIEQTASNGVGHVAWKIAHNLPASYTNIFDSTNFTAGWQWFVSSSNANGEIHWTSGPPATASGGSGTSDISILRKTVCRFDEFDTAGVSASAGGGSLGFISTSTGGGVGVIQGTTNAPGILEVKSGGTVGNNGNYENNPTSYIMRGAFTNEWRFRLGATNNTTDNAMFLWGFIDSTSGDAVDGVYLRYASNSVNFEYIAANNSTYTTNTTSLIPVENVWYKFNISSVITSTTTNFVCTIDGAQSFTFTQSHNVPTGRATGLGTSVKKITGTISQTNQCDYVYLGYSLEGNGR